MQIVVKMKVIMSPPGAFSKSSLRLHARDPNQPKESHYRPGRSLA